jgi:hypothetical protein
MTRENVRRDELHEILNEELHRQDPCGECRFTQAPELLRTPDESGCNWSQDLILRHGRSGNDSCAEVASRVTTQIARRFNMKPCHAAHPAEKPPTDKISSAAQGTMRSRETYVYFQIDTNRINSRGTLVAMNRLERWHRDGVIGLVMSDIAHAEAKAGRNARRSRKAIGYIYSLSFEREPIAHKMQPQIAEILFPQGCRRQGDVNDVRIVCNALHYQYILVTADGVILRNRDALARLGTRIMTDAEAVNLVEQAIQERDAEARDDAATTGEPLPFWVSKD